MHFFVKPVAVLEKHLTGIQRYAKVHLKHYISTNPMDTSNKSFFIRNLNALFHKTTDSRGISGRDLYAPDPRNFKGGLSIWEKYK